MSNAVTELWEYGEWEDVTIDKCARFYEGFVLALSSLLIAPIHHDPPGKLTELRLLELPFLSMVCQELKGRSAYVKFLVLPGPALLLTSDNIKQRLGAAALDRYWPSLIPVNKS